MKDGVYLGLPHEEYLAAPGRLGSTDLTKLYARGAGWWWTSEHNPHRPNAETSQDGYQRAKSTKAQAFGTALHALLLEGREAFAARFAVKPNPNDFPDLLVSAEDIHSALDAAGHPQKRATKKNDLVQAAKAFLPDRHVWDDIIERWSRTARGKDWLESGEAFALDAMYQAAMEQEDVRVICAGEGGVALTEVSVFFTLDGIQYRYRWDSLLPTANVDLKTIGDWRPKPLAWLAGDRIASEHLDIQLAMSHVARIEAYRLIEAGEIYAPSLEGLDGVAPKHFTNVWDDMTLEHATQRDWLRRFPGEAPLRGPDGPGWCWVWVFYQKPESGAAPGLLPLRVLWGDDLHRSGWRKMRLAINTYRENVAQFGLSRPWTQVQALHDTSHAGARRVIVPAYGEQPMAQPGEEEALSWK